MSVICDIANILFSQ